MNILENLINNYYKYLKDKTVLKNLNDNVCEITTPYLDRHNDYIQIYALKDNDKYKLTDDGNTICDLISSRYFLESPLNVILNSYKIELEDNKILTTKATNSDFHLKINNLLEAIINLNYVLYFEGK